MKTLHLIRHARALSPFIDGITADKARRLHPAAIHQVAHLAGQLQRSNSFCPDKLYYSNALRCVETVQLLSDFGLVFDTQMILDEGVYDANADELLEFVQSEDDSISSMAIVGHNPALHQLSLALISEGDDSNVVTLTNELPTLGYVELVFDASSWEEVGISSGILESFIYPSLKKPSALLNMPDAPADLRLGSQYNKQVVGTTW